jgi:hypothetical protein
MPGLVKAADVEAGAKHRPGLPCRVGRQHHHAHLGVEVHNVKVRQQGREVTVFQPVALGRAVQGDGGDTTFDVKDRGRGKSGQFSHAAKEFEKIKPYPLRKSGDSG